MSSSRPRHEPGALGGGIDAFGMLGVPARFDLEPEDVERAFFERSKELHPDRFASAPAAERARALARTRALNDAYQIVKKPVRRAEYLLERAGVKIGDNERADPALLMEVLELREELAEARARKQLAEVGRLQGAMAARRQAVLATLPDLFARDDLQAIKQQLILLRYVDRYLEECDAVLDEED